MRAFRAAVPFCNQSGLEVVYEEEEDEEDEEDGMGRVGLGVGVEEEEERRMMDLRTVVVDVKAG